MSVGDVGALDHRALARHARLARSSSEPNAPWVASVIAREADHRDDDTADDQPPWHPVAPTAGYGAEDEGRSEGDEENRRPPGAQPQDAAESHPEQDDAIDREEATCRG